MTQDQIIQLKVTKKFKTMLSSLAESRGLPLSTYIKFTLIEQLKTDPLWNQLDLKDSQAKVISDFLKQLKS